MISCANTKQIDYREKVIAEIDRLRNELVELSLTIHRNPELSSHEFRAHQWLTEYLKKNDFQIEKNLAGLPTSFRAKYPGEGSHPCIGFLAEYDALPEIGHGCGHNIIAGASVGAAVALKNVLMDTNFPGQIQVIGTPLEERGGGKVIMTNAGVFDELDVAMMVHPGNKTDVEYRSLVSQLIMVEYFGRASHAAMAPEKGVNALDALRLCFMMIDTMRQYILPSSRIHGIITEGGEAYNVIPKHAKGSFSIRTVDIAYMDELIERLICCFEAAEKATGAKLKYTLSPVRYLAMNTNHTLAGQFARNLDYLGIPVAKPDPNAGIGSSDMGNVSHIVPAIHPKLAIVENDIQQHTIEFCEASASEQGMNGLIQGAKALAMTGLDVLLDNELLTNIQQEFLKSHPTV